MNATFEVTPAPAQDTTMRVYEYGVRVDKDCVEYADTQIRLARELYNNIIASMRAVWDEMQQWTITVAGENARSAQDKVDTLCAAFDAAKTLNDEDRMRTVATERRVAWAELSSILGAVRKQHATELRERFWSKIGPNQGQAPYTDRCQAVAQGLG